MKPTHLLSAVGATALHLQTPLYSSYTFNPLHHLSGIAPYYEPADPARDPNPPQGCAVTRAAYLVRRLEMDDNTINVVKIPEGKKNGADSLTPYKSCSRYAADAGSEQQSKYIDTYTGPIATRLNNLASGFNFTADDVTAMQAMCGYDTVIRGSSPFCSTDLFSPDEWLQFEYAQDIQYHYNSGYGSPYAGTIGFPWLNATMDLLAAETAPQDLYISFTHRELRPMVLPGCHDGPAQSCSAEGVQKLLQRRADMFQGYSRVCRNSHDDSTDAGSFYTNSNNGTVVGKRGLIL